MTVAETLKDVTCHGSDLELITSELGKKLAKTGESTDGADSGFSSRNSVASMKEENEKGERAVVVVGDDDDDDDSDDAMTTAVNDECCRPRRIPVGIAKVVSIVGLLYLFICSLDLLGNAFQLLGGKAAGRCFAQSELLLNPITGLMMGILATVLLQSSSTSTSIIITMVSSGIIEVQPAIPIIMGCNIGTTVTNTLVSLAHSHKGKEFERAFSGATVHDVFNWLTVVVLLPLEASAHVLYRLTNVIISSADFSSFKGKKQDLLKTLTKPLTKFIVQVDKSVICDIAENKPEAFDKRILKTFCTSEPAANSTAEVVNATCDRTFHSILNHYHDSLNDTAAGAILLVFSIILLSGCLVGLVKLLNSILKDKITKCLKKTINSKLPRPFAWFTGYVAILIGAGLTVLVQSSSVFTSALTPLVGVGCLKLRRMYPLTLGSNIGTTATGILAALAAPANKLDVALQLALCHLFFNICGISLFYPIHPMRKFPIEAAKFLGRTTNKYRWFAVFYLIVLFFLLPGFVFALSLSGKIPFIITISVIGLILAFIVIVNILQSKCKDKLPQKLQNWNWLPEFMRSLEPLDKLVKKLLSIFKRCKCSKDEVRPEQQDENDNDSDEDDDDDEFDRDNTAVEEDECTECFGKLIEVCCHSKKSELHQNKTKDEGFSEPENQELLRDSRTLFPTNSPIFTPRGHKHTGRLSFNNKLNVSPSSTPLLEITIV